MHFNRITFLDALDGEWVPSMVGCCVGPFQPFNAGGPAQACARHPLIPSVAVPAWVMHKECAVCFVVLHYAGIPPRSTFVLADGTFVKEVEGPAPLDLDTVTGERAGLPPETRQEQRLGWYKSPRITIPAQRHACEEFDRPPPPRGGQASTCLAWLILCHSMCPVPTARSAREELHA